jgi:hypothetical protein
MVLKLHIHKPLEKLREMLSESATLRTLFGAANATAALPKILYGYAEDSPAFDALAGAQAVKALPRALIALEDFSSNVEASATWTTEVVMSVLIQCTTLDADKTKSLSGRYEEFLKRIEGVADDLRELASDNTRLNLRSIRTDVAPQRADINESGGVEIWWTVFIVTAGG